MVDRPLFPRMAIAVLALIGLLDAAYLSIERARGATLACPIGGGCATVQSSPYSIFLGVPIAFLGVLGYAALLCVALLSLYHDDVGGARLPLAQLALASAALLFAAYLSYLQLAVIGAVCFWCALSALLDAAIWAMALRDWRAFHVARDALAG